MRNANTFDFTITADTKIIVSFYRIVCKDTKKTETRFDFFRIFAEDTIKRYNYFCIGSYREVRSGLIPCCICVSEGSEDVKRLLSVYLKFLELWLFCYWFVTDIMRWHYCLFCPKTQAFPAFSSQFHFCLFFLTEFCFCWHNSISLQFKITTIKNYDYEKFKKHFKTKG
jgi:hypothetical protein